MSWYRTYRPRSIAGLHLQKVRDLFQQLMKQGELSQVMLFAGPKGTGKTSTARIIAAMVNDPKNAPVIEHLFFHKAAPKSLSLQEPDPTNKDLASIFSGTSFLVQELDAASNRGIDDIRALKEKIALPPQVGLVTVYILDEAHMLTTEAFNALLKMLEEPPAHAMFILATTEVQKIPATIVSRATVVQFTQASTEEMTLALQTVLDQEKVKYEPEAVAQIAIAAEGSFRDGVKLTEDLSHRLGQLSLKEVNEALPQSVGHILSEILQAVIAKQPKTVAELFAQLRQRQVDQTQITKQFLDLLHLTVLQHLGLRDGQPLMPQAAALFLLQELLAMPVSYSPVPLLPLEVTFLNLIFRSQQKTESAKDSGKSGGTKEPVQTSKPQAAAQPQSTAHLSQPIATVAPVQNWPLPAAKPSLKTDVIMSDNLQPLADGDGTKLLGQWEAFVNLVRDKNSTLAALLKSAELVEAHEGLAVIAVFYKFHQEQLQQPKFLKLIEECVAPVTGGRIKLEFILKEPVLASSVVTGSSVPDSVQPQTLATMTAEALA